MEKAMLGVKLPIEPKRDVEEERKVLADKEFATEVKRLRTKAGLSQKTLGSLIGVEQTIMTRIEKGDYGVTLDLVLRLANAFHDDPHRLASIYWGMGTEQYINANKRVLDEIWDLIHPFYQPNIGITRPPAPTTLPNPLRQLSAHDDAFAQGVIQQRRRPAAKGKDKGKDKDKDKTGEQGKEQEQEQEQEDSKSSDEEI